ncbi:MAG: peptidoglycan recognition family protein [Candidatus Caldatribacteriota bacterium]
MMNYKINQRFSPNFTKGRKGNKIIAIVSHQTAGRGLGSLTWLCNPVSQASAHYLILRDGTIYQLVKDENSAWHAGIVNKPSWKFYNSINPNYLTIGIEHECYPEVGGDGNLTEQQYKATLWLHKQLIQKYNIPIDKDHLIGHYQIDSINRPNCPGKAFPWDKLMKDLTSGVIDDMLEKWQEDMGKNAVKSLAKIGLLNSPEYWEKRIGDKTENWIFFEMIRKLAEKIK